MAEGDSEVVATSQQEEEKAMDVTTCIQDLVIENTPATIQPVHQPLTCDCYHTSNTSTALGHHWTPNLPVYVVEPKDPSEPARMHRNLLLLVRMIDNEDAKSPSRKKKKKIDENQEESAEIKQN